MLAELRNFPCDRMPSKLCMLRVRYRALLMLGEFINFLESAAPSSPHVRGAQNLPLRPNGHLPWKSCTFRVIYRAPHVTRAHKLLGDLLHQALLMLLIGAHELPLRPNAFELMYVSGGRENRPPHVGRSSEIS